MENETRTIPITTSSISLTSPGFFAFRSPLLPIKTFMKWSSEIKSNSIPFGSPQLKRSLEEDRLKLNKYLQKVFLRSEIRDALFIASPSLESHLDSWYENPNSNQGKKIEKTIIRYFARMTGRSTPFGLFAGCSTGLVGKNTVLTMVGSGSYLRHTRLNMTYFQQLISELVNDQKLAKDFIYKTNSSLYFLADQIYYFELRKNGHKNTHHLVNVEYSNYLKAILDEAKWGTTIEELTRTILKIDSTIFKKEIERFIFSLIDNQILKSELELRVTGLEPIDLLIKKFAAFPKTKKIAQLLKKSKLGLELIDKAGLGATRNQYYGAVEPLQGLPGKVDLNRLFQVDMVKPAPKAKLGYNVINEIIYGVELLQYFTISNNKDGLEKFRKSFYDRYGEKEVPLVEVLNNEIGIGFQLFDFQNDERQPKILNEILAPRNIDHSILWDDQKTFLFQKLSEALDQDLNEIVLEIEDIERFKDKNMNDLPDAIAAIITLAGNSEEAIDNGDFQIYFKSVVGPSGVNMLGRFGFMDKEIEKLIKNYLTEEATLKPNAIFAEIAHNPEVDIGNMVLRPILREYEIPILVESEMQKEFQIQIEDLQVSLINGQITLRSERLNREIIPRLTCAHNYALSDIPIYKFLCALQHQNTNTGIFWNWSPFESAPFLPRVRMGKLILSLAQWVLNQKELQNLQKLDGEDLFREIQLLRIRRKMPRFVLSSEGDREILIDLENVLSIESLIDMTKHMQKLTLIEMFPSSNENPLQGPEGRFVNEMIVPLLKKVAPIKAQFKNNVSFVESQHRFFPPGSEWLYVKLYSGPIISDRILCHTIKPLLKKHLSLGTINYWFFIRYDDPESHIRLRFFGDPKVLHTTFLSNLTDELNTHLYSGQLWKIQIDTYEREVERYGGLKGVKLAERIFHIDSEVALSIFEYLSGDEGISERWRLCFYALHLLLESLDLSLVRKCAFVRKMKERYNSIYNISDLKLKHYLKKRFRKERYNLEDLLKRQPSSDKSIMSCYSSLVLRNEKLVPIFAKLRNLDNASQLSMPLMEIVPSFHHMFVNRMLHSDFQMQELIMYDFLYRIYNSQIAKKKI